MKDKAHARFAAVLFMILILYIAAYKVDKEYKAIKQVRVDFVVDSTYNAMALHRQIIYTENLIK